MHALVLLLLVGVASAGFAPLHKVDNSPKGRYIIKFKDNVDVDSVTDGIQSHVQALRLGQAKVSHRYHKALKGMAAQLSDEALEYIRTLDAVEYVSEDGVAHALGIPWGLDRINERQRVFDNSFTTHSAYKEGAGVHIYVVDTGIRETHKDFGGRATAAFDAYGGTGADCQGHGTHCAGIAAGNFYGVAKQATVMGVKVLGDPPCSGFGYHSSIIQGLDFIVTNGTKPAVVSMSLGGPSSPTFEDAVRNVVAEDFTVVVAAGNENQDACNVSPAFISEVITVASTDDRDYRSSFSNYGSCVDIFAPGSYIESAYYTSDSATEIMSGTSMACPHVAGVAALYLSQSPHGVPIQVGDKLRMSGTGGLIQYPSGTPNVLVYIDPSY